jgi:sporulation protein YlmC with PRC-barrel domain
MINVNRKRNKHIVSTVAVAGVLSLGIAPAWALQSSQSKQSSASRQQSKLADGMIAANALQGHQVLDSNNREIGTIENLFIDPQTGRIQRADIDFSIGSNETYSVKWDQLKVRQQGQDVAITLDQSVVQRVQQARGGDRGDLQEGVYGQQQRDKDQRAGGSGVIGGGSDKQQPISASQLTAAQLRKVQQELNKKGFHAGQVNGQWSSETQAAIRNFQQSKGLTATGQLDERTVDELGLDADEFRQSKQSGGSGASSGSQSNQRSTR